MCQDYIPLTDRIMCNWNNKWKGCEVKRLAGRTTINGEVPEDDECGVSGNWGLPNMSYIPIAIFKFICV